MAKQIWMPDIYIDKAKDVRKPAYFTQAAYLRLYNNSLIKYSARLNYDVACPMDFCRLLKRRINPYFLVYYVYRYPADEQNCFIKFESFGHSIG